MIIGEKLDIKPEDLNVIPVVKAVDTNQPYHRVVTMDELWQNYNGSDGFREQCLKAGYKLTSLYPVYHHGWEMDLWAADAIKDGKKYFLTTNHGSLEVEEAKEEPGFSLKRLILSILGKI